MTVITSTSNSRVKKVARLSSRRHREAQQQTVVEGSREVRRCLDAGIQPVEAYVCPPILSPVDHDLTKRLLHSDAVRPVEVTPEVYEKMAYRGASGGVLLVIAYTLTGLDALALGAVPFLVVVEGAEKPGNIGAILRTADAAGVDGLILCSGGTDLHNPNVIRASLGTRFTVPCAEAPTGQVIDWLANAGIQTIAATPDAPQRYTQLDMRRPLAIVTGSEADGLSHEWLAAANQQVSIPMFGAADSLNLATSTALLLYEVVRQRQG